MVWLNYRLKKEKRSEGKVETRLWNVQQMSDCLLLDVS